MSKLSFKRIALVVVSTLGLGVLSSGPSLATTVASSDTLTLSATSSTIAAGETASVTVTQTVISQAVADSIAVNIADQSSPAGGDGTIGLYVTDSSNAFIRTTAQASADLLVGARDEDYNGVAGLAYTTTLQGFMGAGASAEIGPMSVTYSLRFMAPTTAGTYVFRVYTSYVSGSSAIAAVPLTWTVTVTANASNTGAVNSKFWMNRVTEYAAFWNAGGNPNATTYKGIEADSALVVSAGTTSGNTAHAVITPVIMNSSDTKVSTQTGARVQESMTITISGPGALRVYSAPTTGAGAGFVNTAYVKQVTLAYNESAVVYSDGTAGVATISAFIGAAGNAGNPARALTQGTKSITFVGRATTFEVSGFTAGQRAGGNVAYTGIADSATASTATIPSMGAGYVPALRFVAKDSAGNAVITNELSTSADASRGFYAISSDTSIVARGTVSATNTFATNGDRRNSALPCSYDSVNAYWYCEGRVFDSGTVTLTIVDSRTITANGNATTDTTHAVYKSAAFSVTFAGAGNTGTITLDKKTYNVNEKVSVTMTCKDGVGRNIADGAATGCWTGLNWVGAEPSFGNDASVNAAGGRFTDLDSYMVSGNSFVAGVDTMTAFAPTTAGTYTLRGRTAGATTDSDILSFTVVDPVAVANAAAIAASQAAADAATDAALEAIDAANAATDAANLAAEAADAATVAAEEARDAADAATAAVEALATEVASMMAALKAQITTLARTVAKIAKKVKA